MSGMRMLVNGLERRRPACMSAKREQAVILS
jgi:hypothetical protein